MLSEEETKRLGERLLRSEYCKTGKIRVHFRWNVAIFICEDKTIGIDRETGNITAFDAPDTTSG